MSDSKITRRRFLGQTAATLTAASLGQFPLGVNAIEEDRAKKAPPNILFIMGDDMGWADLSCYGQTSYATKYLDKLARQGVRLTDHYANSPVCSQTRVAFNTGQYQQRLPVGNMEPLFYIEDMVTNGLLNSIGIPPSYPTIATVLRDAGYHTALFGKWHCGYLPNFGPVKNGYEEFYGFLSGGVHHFTHNDDYDQHDLWSQESPVCPAPTLSNPAAGTTLPDLKCVAEDMKAYDTDMLADKAIDFIKRQKKGAPFFLNLAFHSTHWPWLGPKDADHPKDKPYAQAMESFNYGSVDTYAQQVISLDNGVGRVLAQLEKSGLASNTIVVFVSDNGGERYSNAWPFVGSKGFLYEGGIRIPGIVRWPGKLPVNKVSRQASISFDWPSTFLAAAGIQAPSNYEGVNLMPILQTAGTSSEVLAPRTLYWRFKGQHAVRDGDLKYLLMPKNTDVTRLSDMPYPGDAFDEVGLEYLFDLSKDPREQANLANVTGGYLNTYFGAQQSSDFTKLKSMFDVWNNGLPAEKKANLRFPAKV